ncbi:MAG: hypothetical protein HY748_17020 [Elusimicrobia bacterium]|nr:hypothetical protein [Elusimicrobiota bacterium]
MTKKKESEEPKAPEKKDKKRGASGKGDGGEPTPDKPVLDELVLNHKTGKYSAIPLISLWAKELRKREEHRHLTPNELLELAMEQVLNGTVGWEDLKKALANGAAAKPGLEGLGKIKKEK